MILIYPNKRKSTAGNRQCFFVIINQIVFFKKYNYDFIVFKIDCPMYDQLSKRGHFVCYGLSKIYGYRRIIVSIFTTIVYKILFQTQLTILRITKWRVFVGRKGLDFRAQAR